MKKISILTGVLASFFLMTSCGGGDEINISNDINAVVDGYVYNGETGNPIEGVKVVVSDKASNSNAEGYFKIGGLSSGNWCAKIQKEGFATVMDCGFGMMPTDFYGDEFQMATIFELIPANNQLELTFRYEEFNEDEQEMMWYDVPANIEVNLEYSDDSYIDVFETQTTNSSGRIVVDNVAYTDIKVDIDFVLGTDEYNLNTTLTEAFLKSKNGVVRIEVSKSDFATQEGVDM
ncbi:MAG: carboxypeptidase-like regulatory domain-containing protein [Bacteroidota bacterium]